MIPRHTSRTPAAPAEETACRIILADDHALIREGLKLLIATQQDRTVVGEAADGASLAALLKDRPAELLVLDLGMPGLTGLRSIGELRQAYPRLKILILTANTDPQMAQAALAAGADGYVVKGSDLDELFDALAALQRGHPYVSLPLRDAKLQQGVGTPGGIPFDATTSVALTRRESELLVLIAGGATTRAVAARLGISPHTARKHRENLMRKLDLHSATELAAYAVRVGLPVG
ncbi:response regulator [Bosea sp. 2YAB26]|uniref:response regulator n=1 Tax=Bosea sp. 2YAB26 TaxID=3237478 RepID=UPI003F8F6531